MDVFGHRVGLSGDGLTLAVAAAEDSNATGINGNQANNSAPGAGAVYVFTRSMQNVWSQQAYIKASNTQAGDAFGYEVMLSHDGTTLAVSATHEDSNATGIGGDQADNSAMSAGSVYVFTRSMQDVWSQQAYIKASNTDANDSFGFRLALSGNGDTLAVHASHESSNATGIDGNQADDSAPNAGAVYLFVRDGQGVWSQQAYVKGTNTEAYDRFGHGLALSYGGAIMAIGAHREMSNATGFNGDQADNSADYAGAVYLFTRDEFDTWSQRTYIKAPHHEASDSFSAVALSADGATLAVGATGEDGDATGFGGDQLSNAISQSGAVFLY